MRHKQIPISQLQILQINVARSDAAQDAVLQLIEQGFHVLLIQEPYISHDHTRRLTRRHPSFRLFAPVEDWSHRPRALTYVIKHLQLRAERLPYANTPCSDLTAIHLRGKTSVLIICNLYNAPTSPSCIEPGRGANCLTSCPLPPGPCLVAGDFNLHHPSGSQPEPQQERRVLFKGQTTNTWFF